jgi:two-component system, chemotaxis family, chemotaxis protein CheY
VIGLNIMIVDDSLLAIRKMEAMLLKMGHYVRETAANGAEALEKYRQSMPDLVTMDITMPEMDGIEATEKIIAEFPDAKIIIVTSHGQEEMVRQAINAGASGYVVKPVDPDAMAEHIQRVFDI